MISPKGKIIAIYLSYSDVVATFFFFFCQRLLLLSELVNFEGANEAIFAGKLKWKNDINRVNMLNTSIRLENNFEKQTNKQANNETFFLFGLRQ